VIKLKGAEQYHGSDKKAKPRIAKPNSENDERYTYSSSENPLLKHRSILPAFMPL